MRNIETHVNSRIFTYFNSKNGVKMEYGDFSVEYGFFKMEYGGFIIIKNKNRVFDINKIRT